MNKYSVRLGVSVFNRIIVANSESEAIEQYIKELVEEDSIIVSKEEINANNLD